MTRPLIGVTGSHGRGRAMWWFHVLALRWYGARPVRLVAPADLSLLSRLDGLIVGGGDDIGAELYNGTAVPDVRIDPERDELERIALEIAIDADIPVFGICRGAQMINVFYGGSLFTDIHAVYQQAPKMRTPLPRKRVCIAAESRLRAVMGIDEVDVNSLHHQSVDQLGAGLEVSGRDEHGIVQAIEDPAARFRLGVQWHPEFLIYRTAHRRLFRAFVDAVRTQSQ